MTRKVEYSNSDTTITITILTTDEITLNLLRIVLNDKKNCKSELEVVGDTLVVKTTVNNHYPHTITSTLITD